MAFKTAGAVAKTDETSFGCQAKGSLESKGTWELPGTELFPSLDTGLCPVELFIHYRVGRDRPGSKPHRSKEARSVPQAVRHCGQGRVFQR